MTTIPATQKSRRLLVLKVILGLLALGFLIAALADQWGDVRSQLAELRWWSVAGSFVAVCVGMAASMLSYRALLADLGSPLPTTVVARVFFLSQLGKYVPGSVWALVAQTELARERGVPRSRSAAAVLTSIALSIGIGILLALGTLPLASGADGQLWWLLVLAPVALLTLSPSLVTWSINRVLTLVRREPLEHPLSRRGVVKAVGWLVVMWIGLGTPVLLLGLDLGADFADLWPAALGGFAAAWVAGFVVFVAPAGVGPREYVLVLVLASVLPGGAAAALGLSVVVRLVMTAADLVLAGVALMIPIGERTSGVGWRRQ
ncbi:MAG: lysylphosphatidylglycerol synthase domain-containing protein [Sporichthyaceae bacterium]